MCTRNVHSYTPHGLCGYLLLACSYITCLIAVGLIALNVLPYHIVFLRYLSESCDIGYTSWAYYYYCFWMMVFSEVMVYGNFFFAIATAPGYVKHEIWSKAPIFNGKRYSENPFEVTQLDRYGKLRYCGRCEQFKPDNAHHCAMCNRCVYRMDHHCPWINNCVGRNNAKYFLLFVAYIPVGAFHIVFTTAYSCYYHLKQVDFSFGENSRGDGAVFPALIFVISIMFSLCMGICFGCFASHFLYMAYRGETSISAHVAKKTAGVGAAANEEAPAREKEIKMQIMNIVKKDSHVYDVFGSDRRWWKMICCYAPVRDDRGLPDETVLPYAADFQKLV